MWLCRLCSLLLMLRRPLEQAFTDKSIAETQPRDVRTGLVGSIVISCSVALCTFALWGCCDPSEDGETEKVKTEQDWGYRNFGPDS